MKLEGFLRKVPRENKTPAETAGACVTIVAMPLRLLALEREACNAEQHEQARGRLGDNRRGWSVAIVSGRQSEIKVAIN